MAMLDVRCCELSCHSYHMSLQQVGHKPTPTQSTWNYWLCVFSPLPPVQLPPPTCLPREEWLQTKEM